MAASTRSRTSSASTTALASFRATTGTLTTAQRTTVVEQAMALIDGLYVHLPLKRAMHATDPVQRLRLLAQHLPALSERQFHDELIGIFTDIRDLHTNYVLPSPFADQTAVLPFLVEEYAQRGKLRYLVTKVAQGLDAPGFEPGVTLTAWSGVPFERAVEVNADHQAGSNLDARRARGLEAMTIRWLGMSPMPDEDWVIVGYTDLAGQEREFRFEWQVLGPDPAPNGVDPADARHDAARKLGIDARFEFVRRAKKRLFNPAAMVLEAAALPSPRAGTSTKAKPAADDASTMPDVFSFRTVPGTGGPYGYIRIWTFSVDDDGPFLDEFVRIAGLLPQNGLILDVRGNGGGLITAAENLLQLLTPRSVEPSGLSFRCTPLTLDLCQRFDFVSQWEPSIARSVETGSSSPRPCPSTIRRRPTNEASGTRARSSSSPTRSATAPPTSSPPASRTTASVPSWAPAATPAPAAPTCGTTHSCASSSPGPRAPSRRCRRGRRSGCRSGASRARAPASGPRWRTSAWCRTSATR